MSPLARRGFLSGLAAFPIAGGAVALPIAAAAAAAADPIPALHAEMLRVTALLDGSHGATEEEDDALSDIWTACDDQAIRSPATTPAGAIASIEWARGELLAFGFNAKHGPDDKGARLILALLDGAIGALRRSGGATQSGEATHG